MRIRVPRITTDGWRGFSESRSIPLQFSPLVLFSDIFSSARTRRPGIASRFPKVRSDIRGLANDAPRFDFDRHGKTRPSTRAASMAGTATEESSGRTAKSVASMKRGGYMRLSTRSRYGTRILLELARRTGDEPMQVGEISRRQNISVKYLEQLIRTLKSARIVDSVRGPKGGHTLIKPPEEITLGFIVRLFEGQPELVECISDPEVCRRSEDCRVRQAWKQATEALFHKLDTITVADLLCDSPDDIDLAP
jgi:Rrf2 family transcriptional regulator, iron-sulfur cluster assembly transcription factor